MKRQEFLAGKIAAEARRTGVALSDVERKMLYFSETGWTLPDIADVCAAFDRDYDQAGYEKKIAGIVRQLRETRAGHPDLWMEAVGMLREGDHYLLVMIEQADAVGRPRGDVLKLAIAAAMICIVLLAAVFMLTKG